MLSECIDSNYTDNFAWKQLCGEEFANQISHFFLEIPCDAHILDFYQYILLKFFSGLIFGLIANYI